MGQRENIIQYVKPPPCTEFVVLVSNTLRLSFTRVRCGFAAAVELKKNQKYKNLCSFCA